MAFSTPTGSGTFRNLHPSPPPESSPSRRSGNGGSNSVSPGGSASVSPSTAHERRQGKLHSLINAIEQDLKPGENEAKAPPPPEARPSTTTSVFGRRGSYSTPSQPHPPEGHYTFPHEHPHRPSPRNSGPGSIPGIRHVEGEDESDDEAEVPEDDEASRRDSTGSGSGIGKKKLVYEAQRKKFMYKDDDSQDVDDDEEDFLGQTVPSLTEAKRISPAASAAVQRTRSHGELTGTRRPHAHTPTNVGPRGGLPPTGSGSGNRLKRRPSHGSGFDAVRSFRRSKSIDSGTVASRAKETSSSTTASTQRFDDMTDQDLVRREAQARRRVEERRKTVDQGIVAKNAEQAFRRASTKALASTPTGTGSSEPTTLLRSAPSSTTSTRRRSTLTWAGEQPAPGQGFVHGPLTPPHVNLEGSLELSASVESLKMQLPPSAIGEPHTPTSVVPSPSGAAMTAGERSALSHQRKMLEIAQKEAMIRERNARHDPEHVRAKRWLEAITLSRFSFHLLSKGLRTVADTERKAWARRTLSTLFVPLWKCYHYKLRSAAEGVIDQFLLGAVARKRLYKRNKASDIIRNFLQKKSHFFPMVIRWYAHVMRRVQRRVRQFLERREAQVELNYRKARIYEEETYWYDAKFKRDRLEAKRRGFVRQQVAATKEKKASASPSASGTSDTKKEKDKDPAVVEHGPLAVWDESVRPVVECLPQKLLKRQIRTLISKKAREWHREEIRRDLLKKQFVSSTGSTETPHVSPEPEPLPGSAAEGSLRRTSSVRREIDALKLRHQTHFNFLFAVRECKQVLDDTAHVAAAITNDMCWKLHLIDPVSGVPLDVENSGSEGASPVASPAAASAQKLQFVLANR